MVDSGLLYSCCDDLRNLLCQIFDNSSIASSFSLGSSKVSNEISYGLGPFFHNNVVKQSKDSRRMYTLSYDEAPNDAGNKKLDLHIHW